MNHKEILQLLEKQKSLMIDVATGGSRIQDVNDVYKKQRRIIRAELKKLNFEDPNPFYELWKWYGKWSSGELPSYQSRRDFISDMYQPLIDNLIETPSFLGEQIFLNVDSWEKLTSNINELGDLLRTAESSEQFQSIGLLCREMLISLGQLVFDPAKHLPEGDSKPSLTDAKRMLVYYISYKMKGSSQEATRRYAKATISLANDLQHNRIADFTRAALCTQATISTINIIGILSGHLNMGKIK